MKFFIFMVVMLSATVLSTPQERKHFDCVVTSIAKNVYTVKCEASNPNELCKLQKNKEDEECKRTVMDIPAENWNEFPAWQYQTNEDPWHLPIKQEKPVKGQLLKASYVMGRFVPLKPCAVRGYEALQEYCKDRDYCRPPIQLATPYECGEPQTDYIKRLIAEALK